MIEDDLANIGDFLPGGVVPPERRAELAARGRDMRLSTERAEREGRAADEVRAALRALPAAKRRELRAVVRCKACGSCLIEAWPIGGGQTLIVPAPSPHDAEWSSATHPIDLAHAPSLHGHPDHDNARDVAGYLVGCRCSAVGAHKVLWTTIANALRAPRRVVTVSRDTPSA